MGQKGDYFTRGRFKIRKKVEEKYGPGPYTKEQKREMRKEVDKRMWMKLRARSRYSYRKIRFEKNRVNLNVPGYYAKRGTTFTASQLIRHFKPEEIRRAAAKYLKLKERYHI